jgi:hypothetical protein
MRDDRPRRDHSRSRSRSPHRRRDPERRGGRRGGGGFRWKEKRRDNDDRDKGERRPERDYRNRSPRRDERRDRDEQPRERRERHATSGSKASNADDKFDMDSKFGPSSGSKKPQSDTRNKPKAEPAAQPTGEPMIIVHVNDRLGTKAAIPCLASDPIKLFKAQVAARIGRQPHEILLKRQGERPFKDQLTLEDYGVSNGVQIDLEIDTGE